MNKLILNSNYNSLLVKEHFYLLGKKKSIFIYGKQLDMREMGEGLPKILRIDLTKIYGVRFLES